jgi:hypothetical protein
MENAVRAEDALIYDEPPQWFPTARGWVSFLIMVRYKRSVVSVRATIVQLAYCAGHAGAAFSAGCPFFVIHQ